MNIKPFALIALGCSWLACDLYLMAGKIILRETRLGLIARFLDRLPTLVSGPIFLLLWLALLLGWTIPLGYGFKWLFRPKHSN